MQKALFCLLTLQGFALNISTTQAADFPTILSCKAILGIANYTERSFKEDPLRIWESSKITPFAFVGSIDFRIKEIKKTEGLYVQLIQKLKNKNVLTQEDINLIVNIESDPVLNLIEEEFHATREFEKFILPEFPDETKNLYFKTVFAFKTHADLLIKQQNELRQLLSPRNISSTKTKMLIEGWIQSNNFDSLNTNRMLDVLTGTEEYFNPYGILNLHRSPLEENRTHPLIIIKKITETLGLQKDDIIIDLKAGSGRTLIGASILNPHLDFIGFETSPQKLNSAKVAIQTHNLSNIKFISNDYLYSNEYHEFEKAKAIFSFEKLNELTIEKTLQILKKAASQTNEKKYIILTKQEEANLLLKPNDFHLIEVLP
jgi:hypothetical protein